MVPFALHFPTTTFKGAELYVDANTGSDTNPGTIGSPFKSIQAAVDKIGAAGGSVLLRAGTFYLTAPVHVEASGISISPYQSESVVVSGGVAMSPKWTKTAFVGAAGGPPSPAVDTYVADVPAGISFLELFNASNVRQPSFFGMSLYRALNGYSCGSRGFRRGPDDGHKSPAGRHLQHEPSQPRRSR